MNGRNLLRFTGHPTYAGDNTAANRQNGWCRWNSAATIERTSEGIKYTHNAASSSLSGFVVPLISETLLQGGEDEVLTLSFQYRGNLTGKTALYLLANTGGNVQRRTNVELVSSETEWRTFTDTVYFPTLGTRYATALLVPYSGGDTWLEIKDGTMKLEYGTTATPWRPAPEDTEQPSDLVYASEGVDLGDTSGLATDADAQQYASDAQAAATAAAAADATRKAGAAETAAKGYADAQVATRARTFATGWEYRQTADTAVVDGKTYYTRSGTDPDWEWTAVENPVDADIATYWELLPERPVPPYDPGDVWLQGDGGAILACTAAKASGESFSEDDWTLASGYTDDAAAAVLEGGIKALRQADTALSGRIDSAAEASRNAIAALDGRVAAAEGSISGVSGRLVSLEDYVRVVGGDHLELGKAGSSVTASLENDRLAFLLLGQDAPVAYIAADEDGTGKLFVTQAVVVSELQFGHGKWAWTERKNGNMALKWRGGEA